MLVLFIFNIFFSPSFFIQGTCFSFPKRKKVTFLSLEWGEGNALSVRYSSPSSVIRALTFRVVGVTYVDYVNDQKRYPKKSAKSLKPLFDSLIK